MKKLEDIWCNSHLQRCKQHKDQFILLSCMIFLVSLSLHMLELGKYVVSASQTLLSILMVDIHQVKFSCVHATK